MTKTENLLMLLIDKAKTGNRESTLSKGKREGFSPAERKPGREEREVHLGVGCRKAAEWREAAQERCRAAADPASGMTVRQHTLHAWSGGYCPQKEWNRG